MGIGCTYWLLIFLIFLDSCDIKYRISKPGVVFDCFATNKLVSQAEYFETSLFLVKGLPSAILGSNDVACRASATEDMRAIGSQSESQRGL